jgi:hypothetical protein
MFSKDDLPDFLLTRPAAQPSRVNSYVETRPAAMPSRFNSNVETPHPAAQPSRFNSNVETTRLASRAHSTYDIEYNIFYYHKEANVYIQCEITFK